MKIEKDYIKNEFKHETQELLNAPRASVQRAERRYEAHKGKHVVRGVLRTAWILSYLTQPFYLPIVGLMALFTFSYLALLPLSYKIIVLLMTYIFTIILPTWLIRLYRRYQGWNLMRLFSREGRMIPYVISIASYFSCFYLMDFLHIPHIISSIIVAGLFIQIICAVLNVWWKISTHMAAIGGFCGALMAFAEIFSFNPLWWLSVLMILSGMVGTGRMLLRVHTLQQVVYGFLVGALTAFIVVIMI